MLIDKKIIIKTNPSNYKHYKQNGYEFNKCGDEIEIDISHLPESSHVKVNCKCYNCSIEKITPYFAYFRFIKNHGFYTCNKCCNVKNKLTCFQRYGNYYSTTDEYRRKINETIKLKYGGAENYSSEIKKITNQKVLEKYGVDNVFKLDEIKSKIKKSIFEKYGVEHALQNQEIFEKSQKTGLKINDFNIKGNKQFLNDENIETLFNKMFEIHKNFEYINSFFVDLNELKELSLNIYKNFDNIETYKNFQDYIDSCLLKGD